MENVEELQLKVEKLLYKNDVDVLLEAAEKLKYEKIEELKEKSRGQVINLVRRCLQEIIEGIESPTAKNQLLNDVFLTLGGSPELAPVNEKEGELSKLQQEYEQLKSQQEKQLLEMQAKIDKLEIGVNDKCAKVKVNSSVNASVIEVPSSTRALLRRDFKILGQIGEPGQAEKLTYISLNHQIESGLLGLPQLRLPQLRKILRIHYCEKTASELYQQLTTMCQKPKESVQQFLLRIMDARNKVVFASKEADTDFIYGSQLIQNTFLKALETGIRDEYLTTSLRPILRKDGVSDEELMRSINELASQKTESENKLGLTERLSAKNAKVSSVEGAKGKKGTSPEASEKQDLLAAIKGIKSELSSLKAKVEEQVSKSNAPFQPRYPRGCPKCRRENNGNTCRHCFNCCQAGHLASHCPQRKAENEQGPFPRDRRWPRT